MEKIIIIVVIVSVIILAILYWQVVKTLKNKNTYEKQLQRIKMNLQHMEKQRASLSKEQSLKRKSLTNIEKKIHTKEEIVVKRNDEIAGLENQLQLVRAKFRDFSMRDGYEEFERLEEARSDMDKYVKDVQETLKEYKGYFNPSKCAATINMLLEKLQKCCQIDMSDDVDDMLRQDLMDIANETKKSDEEEETKKKKKRGQSYER